MAVPQDTKEEMTGFFEEQEDGSNLAGPPG